MFIPLLYSLSMRTIEMYNQDAHGKCLHAQVFVGMEL